jgi:uncharacterized protein YdeI (YjbR/CyaY-like superfamily)
MPMKPTFFATPREFRAWLEAHHATHRELSVGFYKRGTGRPSISWPESVDEALCFGWIDGVRKSLSDEAYTIRFTPRKRTSIWSAINVTRVAALESLGRMAPAGRVAFAARKPERTGVYSFERDVEAQLTQGEEKKLRANTAAAAFFDAQPPWYRRTAKHWVVSAKREATRARRLDQLIRDSAENRKIGPLTSPASKTVAPSPSVSKASSRKRPGALERAPSGKRAPAGKRPPTGKRSPAAKVSPTAQRPPAAQRVKVAKRAKAAKRRVR